MVHKDDMQKVADTLARELTQQQTDPNEVASALTALLSNKNGHAFFRFLDTVISDGQAVVRSGRTLDYYRSIRAACRKHLTPYEGDPDKMAEILGWAVRLMRYYRVEDRLEQPTPQTPMKPTQRTPTEPTQRVERETGRVKWFNTNKGYGFIAPDSGRDDLFFHHSQLPDNFKSPPNGAQVTFVIGKGPKGRSQAQDVKPV